MALTLTPNENGTRQTVTLEPPRERTRRNPFENWMTHEIPGQIAISPEVAVRLAEIDRERTRTSMAMRERPFTEVTLDAATRELMQREDDLFFSQVLSQVVDQVPRTATEAARPTSTAFQITLRSRQRNFQVRDRDIRSRNTRQRILDFENEISNLFDSLMGSMDYQAIVDDRILIRDIIENGLNKMVGNSVTSEKIKEVIKNYLAENLELKVVTENNGGELEVNVELKDTLTDKVIASDGDTTELNNE